VHTAKPGQWHCARATEPYTAANPIADLVASFPGWSALANAGERSAESARLTLTRFEGGGLRISDYKHAYIDLTTMVRLISYSLSRSASCSFRSSMMERAAAGMRVPG
jgi:hypothetical protein